MVKYEWDESNGVSVPTNKLMTIDADEYYVGMPLKKVDAETVAPTDGDPEYICLAQRNAGDEIRPLQIPVQEVFPDAVYTKIMEDGTEEKVKFGGGGSGKIKPEQLPEGYPNETITVNSRFDFYASIAPWGDRNYDGPFFYGDDICIPVYAGEGVSYDTRKKKWTLPEGYNWYFAVNGEEIKIPQFNEFEYATTSTLNDTFNGCEITVKSMAGTIWLDGETGNGRMHSILLMVNIVGYGADKPLPDIQLEYRKVEIEPLDPKFLPEGIGGGDGDNLFMVNVVLEINPNDYSESIYCTKTYEQVLAAAVSGKVVVLRHVVSFGGQQAVNFCTSMVAYSPEKIVFRYATANGELYSFYLYPDNTFEEYGSTLINHAEITTQSGLIMASQTPGSEKKFRIEVDDNGTITATEV